ncbi:MAG TPA: hypothetical protein PLK76_03950 [bacterium]|nr:hypothetical protein [bacterium]
MAEETYFCNKCNKKFSSEEIIHDGNLQLCPPDGKHVVELVEQISSVEPATEECFAESVQKEGAKVYCHGCQKYVSSNYVMYHDNRCSKGHNVMGGEEPSRWHLDWVLLRNKISRPVLIFLSVIAIIVVLYVIWNGMTTKTVLAAPALTANLQVTDWESRLAEAEKKIQNLTTASMLQIESAGQKQTARLISTNDSLLADLHEEEYSLKSRLNGEYATGLVNMDSLKYLATEMKGQKESLAVLARKSDQMAEDINRAREDANLAKIVAEEAGEKADNLAGQIITITANGKELRAVVVDFFKSSTIDTKSFGRKTVVAKAAEEAIDRLSSIDEPVVANDSAKVMSDEEALERLLR